MNAFRYNKCAWTFFFLSKNEAAISVFLRQYDNMFHVKPFCLKENWLHSVGLVRYSLYNAVQIYIIYMAKDLGERPGPVWKWKCFLKPKCEGARVPGWEDARDHRPPVCMNEDRSISCISFLKRILVLTCKARYAVALLLFLVSFWNREAWPRNSICHSERMGD